MNRQLAMIPMQDESSYDRFIPQYRQEDFNCDPMILKDKVESVLRNMGFNKDKSISYLNEVLSVTRTKGERKIKWNAVITATKVKFLMTIFITTLEKYSHNNKDFWNIRMKLRAYPVHDKKYWTDKNISLKQKREGKYGDGYLDYDSGMIKVESGPVRRINVKDENGICKVTSVKEIAAVLNNLDMSINM